ncbi:hypothetical protein FG386_002067 [Cryptosporidium ryanae]|uniref:uncharacterized protein n=1 Tax=Cryptosporidium ryanae TaxID=515981 RepID=UPI003519FDB9|nr:hypothetical protein FG386_002067 [Cryptosporidium ryanae]
MTDQNSSSSDINVTYEDQKQINRFSSLLCRKNELVSELEKLKTERFVFIYSNKTCSSVQSNDFSFRIRFGESYYHASEEEATERIEQLKNQVQSTIDTLSDELSTVQQEMQSLKTNLYLKFGSNINLDE